MTRDELACAAPRRRAMLFAQRANFNGVDFVEVSSCQRSLCVHFFGDVPPLFDDHHPHGLKPENVRIVGGRRIGDIRVLALRKEISSDPQCDDCLRVTLDKAGDASIYSLCLVETAPESPDAPAWPPYRGFDPRFACAEFSFRVDCPSELDCKAAPACAPAPGPAPELNYLAKDYASFRQLMLDRLALTMPDWQERHAADLGVTLVELLAYAADHLSYYQDAVATEAYLDTARLRISVRRHARLVDYTLGEGLNARAWVSVATDRDTPPVKPGDFYFITGVPGLATPNGRLLAAADLERVPASRYEAFEPVSATPGAALQFFAAHTEMQFYTWGDAQCCLARGATRATLRDDGRHGALRLQVGEVLLFEEVKGARSGAQADADPTRRHAVCLTRVSPGADALAGKLPLVEIEWAAADALPFALCLSGRSAAPACARFDNVSVARGNVVLVDHGRRVRDPASAPVAGIDAAGECACDGSVTEITPVAAPFGMLLERAPLSFAEPVAALASAAQAFARDAQAALPQVTLVGLPAPDGTAVDPLDPRWIWRARPHLLDSAAADQHLVVEIDDDGGAHLRFGDGDLGRRPAPGMVFEASYRVGNGVAGNVGRESISCMVLRHASWSGLTVAPRNPLAASGGLAPEPVAQAKLAAPHAFRRQLRRAVTADDYAQIAAGHAGLQRAAAQLRWTGSWYAARVGIDPLHTEQADAGLLRGVAGCLQPYRRMGHDLEVAQAAYVALDVELEVCVLPQYARGEIKAELLGLLGNGVLADGRLGLFHPDRLSFGDGVYVSQLLAAAQALEGVASVTVTKLQRLFERAAGELAAGVLALGPMQIAQLDNDPNFPERGRLTLIMGGGR